MGVIEKEDTLSVTILAMRLVILGWDDCDRGGNDQNGE
jgi:hypothetical protein